MTSKVRSNGTAGCLLVNTVDFQRLERLMIRFSVARLLQVRAGGDSGWLACSLTTCRSNSRHGSSSDRYQPTQCR